MSYDRANYRDKWRIERLAARIRTNLGLDQLTVLVPEVLCDALPAHVFLPRDFVEPEVEQRLRRIPWDAFSFSYPDDPTLIVLLNPERSLARQTATLMEELAHHLLGHRPSVIRNDDQGLALRDYNVEQESEAFDLGAALLLPKERIQADVARHLAAFEIAAAHGCSVELVEYRIKRLRLWGRYTDYAA